MHLEPVPAHYSSLDPRYAFILDHGTEIFLWHGAKSKNTQRSKARLVAEKIKKNERKNRAEILSEDTPGDCSLLWKLLGVKDGDPIPEPIVTNILKIL